MTWVQVSDELPREGHQVIVAIRMPDRPAPRYEVRRYRRGEWLDICNMGIGKRDVVVGWMPIPPYKGGRA